MASMAFNSGWSTNGPFFCERMLFRLSLHDKLVGSFVVSRLVAKRGLAPGSQRMVSLHSAFTSAMWVINWIHHNTANRRPYSHMARAAGLSNRDVLMIEIPHLPDRCRTVDVDQPNF